MKTDCILIIKNRALGDSIMGVAAVDYMRSLYPNSYIIYGVPAWVAPLYQNVNGSYDEILPIKLESLSDSFSLWSHLKTKKIDIIYEMHLAGRTKKFFGILSFLKRIPYFFHNHHEMNKDTGVHDQGIIKALIQRDLDGVYSFLGKDQAIPKFYDYCPSLTINDKSKEKKENLLFLGVVATRNTKKWKLSSYVELAKKIKNSYPEISIEIPLSKSQDDLEIQLELERLGVGDFAKIVFFDLKDLAAKMSRGKLYIGNDTGIKHLSIALGLKSYTFFGPEPVNEWHPYDKKKHPFFFLEDLECRTKDTHYCALSECETMLCMDHFQATDVFKTIQGDLDELF